MLIFDELSFALTHERPSGLCSAGAPDVRRRAVALAKLRFESAPRNVPERRVQKNEASASPASQKNSFHAQAWQNVALCRPGGSGGVAAPVPIPNTAVKRPSADGTSSQDAGE